MGIFLYLPTIFHQFIKRKSESLARLVRFLDQFQVCIGKMNWSLLNLMVMLRMNILTYKDLWEWINHPYFKVSEKPKGKQQCLAF